MLKKAHPELNKRSAHYRKQAPFKGSNRQIRGKVLKKLLKTSEFTQTELSQELNVNLNKLKSILLQLEKEGFISIDGSKITIQKNKI